MTQNEFYELIDELELIVIESFMWPVALRIDPEIIRKTFNTDVKMVKYRLRHSTEEVPVEPGKPGEFIVVPSTLTDDIR